MELWLGIKAPVEFGRVAEDACDDKGFTLLELILVMLIVSFSLVALAPALEQ